ncbi:homeobox domain-containing protein [Ditylenchus destructor]|nr:homeobox domain-containing protein [Ditylenchus destructor]
MEHMECELDGQLQRLQQEQQHHVSQAAALAAAKLLFEHLPSGTAQTHHSVSSPNSLLGAFNFSQPDQSTKGLGMGSPPTPLSSPPIATQQQANALGIHSTTGQSQTSGQFTTTVPTASTAVATGSVVGHASPINFPITSQPATSVGIDDAQLHAFLSASLTHGTPLGIPAHGSNGLAPTPSSLIPSPHSQSHTPQSALATSILPNFASLAGFGAAVTASQLQAQLQAYSQSQKQPNMLLLNQIKNEIPSGSPPPPSSASSSGSTGQHARSTTAQNGTRPIRSQRTPMKEITTLDDPAELDEFMAQGEDACINDMKQFITQFSLRQTTVAMMTGVSQPYISKLLNGNHRELSLRCRKNIYSWYLNCRRHPEKLATFVQDPSSRLETNTDGELVPQRRERYVFRPMLIKILESFFETSPFPDNLKRMEIAQQCNQALQYDRRGSQLMPKEVVTPQVIANWFANKRKEMRRKSNDDPSISLSSSSNLNGSVQYPTSQSSTTSPTSTTADASVSLFGTALNSLCHLNGRGILQQFQSCSDTTTNEDGSPPFSQSPVSPSRCSPCDETQLQSGESEDVVMSDQTVHIANPPSSQKISNLEDFLGRSRPSLFLDPPHLIGQKFTGEETKASDTTLLGSPPAFTQAKLMDLAAGVTVTSSNHDWGSMSEQLALLFSAVKQPQTNSIMKEEPSETAELA